MDLEDIHIQNYVHHFLKEMDDLYSLVNKDVLFMYYEPNIDNARAVLKMGAHKVYFYNPEFDYKELDNENIVLIGGNDDKLSMMNDDSVDLIVGLEILEHINDLDTFFAEIKRVIKPLGDIELQGSPMWTCSYGHHLWIEGKYIFYEDSNPFEPWEHLAYDTQADMEKALVEKGLPDEDCKEIARWIFDPVEISRHTPTEIIEAATGVTVDSNFFHKINFKNSIFEICKRENFEYSIKRTYQKVAPNDFFDLAAEKYSESDLKTNKLSIKIKYSAYKSIPCVDLRVNTFDNLEDWIFNVVKEFNKRHNVAGKRIVNATMFNSVPISKMFLALGAKSVFSVSPCVFIEENDKIDNFVHYTSHFEDCDPGLEKVDIIFGLDILTEIIDMERFFEKIKLISNNNTVIYLTGYMPYTAAGGHWINVSGYHFYDDTNPIPYWQHIQLDTKEKFINALIENGVSESYAEYIWTEHDKTKYIERKSPSEIEECANRYKFLYMRKIFHYFPKNEYYFDALQKYSEDDLNTMAMVITSDFPTLNWLDELDIDDYLKMSLSDINLKYKIKDKKVLNITPFVNANVSLGFESFQAKEVVSLDYYNTGMELNGGKAIRCVKQDIEDLANINEKFDIIYGLDVLEHVKDLKTFFENLKNLVKDNGVICLQGSPLWPSDCGHNCMLHLDCGFLQTGEDTLSLEPWEHLAYDTKEEFKDAMLKKGFTQSDSEKVSDFIFNSDEVNRKSYADIINVLNEVEGIYYGQKKILHYSEENEFYKKANKCYTHEELRTKELKLFIRKKLS